MMKEFFTGGSKLLMLRWWHYGLLYGHYFPNFLSRGYIAFKYFRKGIRLNLLLITK